MSYREQIKITKELIEHVADMAMLELKGEEVEAMKTYFEEMLDVFDAISDVEVDEEWSLKVSRELRLDEPEGADVVPFEDLQLRFPKLHQGYLVVPAVRKGDEE